MIAIVIGMVMMLAVQMELVVATVEHARMVHVIIKANVHQEAQEIVATAI